HYHVQLLRGGALVLEIGVCELVQRQDRLTERAELVQNEAHPVRWGIGVLLICDDVARKSHRVPLVRLAQEFGRENGGGSGSARRRERSTETRDDAATGAGREVAASAERRPRRVQ